MARSASARGGSSRGRPAASENKRIFEVVFVTFLLVNAIAAWRAPILDCDEVFNYWEPTHYVNHGSGLQTWEYSPEYAIRSWLYIVLHALAGQTARLKLPLASGQAHEFLTVRLTLATLCAWCQTRLFKAMYNVIEPRVAFLMALIMGTSTGMFYASVAYLPSSFSMYTAMLGAASLLTGRATPRTTEAIWWFGIGAIVGWPFSGALLLPLMVEELVALRLTMDVSSTARRLLSGLVGLLPVIILDLAFNAIFFHRLVFSPWRIVSYNIFGDSSRGPNIFGTEPWHFYLRNLLLNFNLWAILALLAGPLVLVQLLFRLPSVLHMPKGRPLIYITPFYLWLAIFSFQPHKEERFMYPAYPFLCLNAAITLHTTLAYLGHVSPRSVVAKVPSLAKAAIVATAIATIIVLGILRTIGTITAYQAPLKIYAPLQALPSDSSESTLCLGKEWYRFPSSYFLPSNMRARFVKSEFSGLLPGQFTEQRNQFGIPAAWAPSPGMNDQNIEDVGKYVDISSCDYFVDSQVEGSKSTKLEPDYIRDTETWEIMICKRFLDAASTPILPRIFWTPDSRLLPRRLRRQWGEYCLLKRKTTAV